MSERDIAAITKRDRNSIELLQRSKAKAQLAILERQSHERALKHVASVNPVDMDVADSILLRQCSPEELGAIVDFAARQANIPMLGQLGIVALCREDQTLERQTDFMEVWMTADNHIADLTGTDHPW